MAICYYGVNHHCFSFLGGDNLLSSAFDVDALYTLLMDRLSKTDIVSSYNSIFFSLQHRLKMSNNPDKEQTMEGMHTPPIYMKFQRIFVTVLFEISQILNTGLTRHQLNILTDLCEMGVNPEALAKVVQQLKTKKQQQMNSSNNNVRYKK